MKYASLLLAALNGLEMLREIRNRRIKSPVLLLTARDGVDDRVRGLDVGADDYLVKPFAFPELLARIRALLRRPPLQAGNILSMNNLEMDLTQREVRRAGRRIELSPREFSLLEFLMRHPGRVVTKTMLLEHVWDYSFDPQTNVVDVLVHRVRSKVDKDFTPKLIHTIRGVGYRLDV